MSVIDDYKLSLPPRTYWEHEIRTYSKTELGKLYYPEQNKLSARISFMELVENCSPLCEVLDDLLPLRHEGLKQCHNFNANEVELIFFFLGKPGE